MADGDGVRPPETAEKSLGDIVGDVTSKTTLLVQEEIALAKAEVSQKISRLAAGAGAGAAAGVFLVFFLVALVHGLAWLVADVLNEEIWLGYFIVAAFILLLAALAGFLAYRLIRRGTPPTPEMAIEEAKRTRASFEEVRR
jgi:H+/Cl- antiporter ClcA